MMMIKHSEAVADDNGDGPPPEPPERILARCRDEKLRLYNFTQIDWLRKHEYKQVWEIDKNVHLGEQAVVAHSQNESRAFEQRMQEHFLLEVREMAYDHYWNSGDKKEAHQAGRFRRMRGLLILDELYPKHCPDSICSCFVDQHLPMVVAAFLCRHDNSQRGGNVPI
ncbi:hypothetical protein K458DRAFT_381293 [Lentithecium fluviatile CBS 122367]|uniref:Uncharacterized protein n=1 Tax=Lentithecium fluviatile CBS 122367 TaxID=1168545 RepID=A0A6G1JLX8_9PLEO|nr:hypothetical protein K458DRAFT_381293 [Lentithecium fluviatile CBS 122367]